MSWIPAVACLVIPLLLILITRRAVIQQRERKVLREQHPNEQWLWRRDWASRTSADQSHASGAVLWFIAAIWNLISVPVFVLIQERRGDPMFLAFAIFPLIGVGLIGVALYQTLRRRKYGESVCRFDALPVPVGRTLHGEVETKVQDVPQDGFVVRLTCLRRIVKTSGKNTSTEERILWQDEQRAGAGAATPNPNGVRVPFRFHIPADSEPSDESNPRSRVIWRLEAIAEVPGIDYRGVFELPVYVTAQSPEEDGRFPKPAEPPWTPPPTIVFAGDAITIRPSSTAFDWLFYVVFVVIWYGVLALMVRFGVPWFVPLFFGVFGTGVLYLALDKLAGRSTVTANRTQLTSRRTFFGTKVLPSNDIAAIEPRIGNTTNRIALFDLDARLRDGRVETIAKHLRTRRDAEHVATRILRQLGR